jgi:hypothetical protein
MREGTRLRVFENTSRMLTKVCGAKMEKEIGGWRRVLDV